MRKFICIFSLMFFFICAFAQQPRHNHGQNNGQMPNFEKFIEDRVAFVTKAMALSEKDSIKFVPIYKEKLKAKGELMKRSRPTMILPNNTYPDSIYTKAALQETTYKLEDAKIDMEYLKKFQKILTPQQVFGYVQAEKMFVGSFMHGGNPHQNKPKNK